MESRERVLAALDRKPIDRVPMRFNARTEVKEALSAHLGIDTEEGLLERLGIDFRYAAGRYAGPRPRPSYRPANAPPPPERRSAVSSAGYSNSFRVDEPFANMQDASELDGYEAHLAQQEACTDVSRLSEDIDRINAETRYFVGFRAAGRIFMAAQELRGAEQFLVDMALNPDYAHRLLEIRTAHTIRLLEQALPAAKGRIDFVQYNDDLGTQRDLLVSPTMFREFLLPRYRRIFKTVRSFGIRVFMHSCGAIRRAVPDLIDAGVQILNPVQVGARGMAPEGLKRDFGQALAFCGGIDVQSTLPFGTAEDVRQEVRDRISVLGRGGGYILDSTNFIQPDTVPQNVLAMFDTGKEQTGGWM
jgi:uroporphyrinogen decarboxylase